VILLGLALVSLASVWVNGEPVSSADCERAAQAFLHSERSRSPAYRAAVGVSEGVRIKEKTELRDPETGALLGYVLALDPSGYLVMPAETRLVPVIAYSYAGEFPWEESEENILLSMLRLDLRWRHKALAEKGTSQSIPDSNEVLWRTYLETDRAAAAGDSATVYGPLLTTEWHQEAPYNDLCPLDSEHGGRSLVGCVATALAQILNYWQYPTEVAFRGTDDYLTPTHGLAINAASASFVGLDYENGEPSDADKARLCYAAGVSVRMDYCSNSSFAVYWNVARALAGDSGCPYGVVSQRWGYPSAELRSYDSSYAGWGAPYYVAEVEFFGQLADNVIASQPSAIGIYTASDGGHMVVVDGWQCGGRIYHLNYGWEGGDSNGWYSLPEDLPAGYTVINCAILNIRPPTAGSAGDVFAFGYNRQGQLGVGDTIDRWTPTKITALPGPAKSVAAGTNHSLALLENGEVFAFGYNVQGQLGLGDTADGLLPTRIFAAPGSVEAVAAGGYQSFLLENGNVYAFGWNCSGQLGMGDAADRWMPTKITALPGPATAADGGWQHSLILLENGDVYAFGRNGGLLGLGDTVDRWIPTKIATLPGRAVSVVAGICHSFVLLEDGDVYAFGFNGHGALGLGDTVDRSTPTRITALPARAISVAAGQHHSLILLENGDVYACGYNELGQLGLGDGGDYDAYDRWTPTKITSLPGRAASVAAGTFHSLVLLENGDLYAFGWNEYGQLGLGDTAERHSPTRVTTLAGVTAVAGDGGHFLAILGSQAPPPSTDAAFRVESESGNVLADGSFYGTAFLAGAADIAERVPVSDAVEAGTVLELDTTDPGSYRPSQASCSSLIAGVVSTLPGITLGASTVGPQQALIALSGIVPVKVTNEGGPIQPGDLLVSSSTPGYAMRWARPEPCPCALVGKALEPMADERGTILVLLTAH
jgi:alpha-tubulin suppressor-like RCC1 family protein